jgi:transcription elongation factor Elf1
MESEPQPDDGPKRWDSVHKCPRCGQAFRLANLDLKAVTTGMVACLTCDWTGSINIQIVPRSGPPER